MTTKRVSRRRVLAYGGAGAAILGAPGIVRAQPRQLVIGGPGGQEASTRKFLIPDFEKKHNCKVHYDGAQSLPNLKKMQASPDKPPFDIVMMDEQILIFAAQDKLLEPVKQAQVPNLGKLADGSVMRDGTWVTYMNPAISIGYNTRAMKSGIASWAVLWDPAMRERVMIPHPKTTQAAVMFAVAAHFETGKPFKEAQYDLDAAFRKLKQMKTNLLQVYLASAQASALLEQGEAWMAAGFFTTNTLPRKIAGAPVDLARPKEGSYAMPKGIAKVRNAAAPDLADAWIDACLGDEFQKIWQQEFFGAPTNVNVPVDPSLIATKDLLALDWTFHTEKLNEVSDRFDREIAA